MTSDDPMSGVAGQEGAVRVVREAESRRFFEGDELCREYLRASPMWFGTSSLAPGEQGSMDPGHPDSVEVFYCSAGRVIVADGQLEHELNSGDALVIPPGLPHTLRNIGDTVALVVWAGAPGG
jgi:oxalate decarboxylase/phosphoglucose isomerase-like protein (cupin superfamily)